MLGRVLAVVLLTAVTVAGWWWWRAYEQLEPVLCPAELNDFVRCLKTQMPRSASNNPPRPPSLAQRRALEQAARAVYTSALSDAPSCATELPSLIARHYAVQDISAGPRRYCALWEAKRGPKPLGWGTLLVSRKPDRWLAFGAPHPLFDLHTLQQTLDLLHDLDALSLIIAGSHRHAMQTPANCDAWPYPPSDATHQPTGYFSLARAFATTTQSRQRAWWYLEWHGMRSAEPGEACFDQHNNTSLDVFLSNGVEGHVHDFTRRLAAAMGNHHPSRSIAASGGDIPCDKIGSANLLGRYLNGGREIVPAKSCGAAVRPAHQVSGRFVHIEQSGCTTDCNSVEHLRQAKPWRRAIAQTYDAMSAPGIGTRQ